jgi:hypothetical protein
MMDCIGTAGVSSERFELKQNFPNPFNPVTIIPYRLTDRAHVTLCIYDIHGKKVKTPVDGVQRPGDQMVIWNGTDNNRREVSSGLYICKLTVDGVSQIQKMLFLR